MTQKQTQTMLNPARCVVIYDGKFKLKHGQPASFNMHYEGYLSRYLQAFDHVTLISRLYKEEDPTAQTVIGKNATFVSLPLFSNELNFIFNIPRFLWLFHKELNPQSDAVLLRIPSLVGIFAVIMCKIKNIPYAVEVAGDPAADFSSGTAGRQGLKNRFLRPLHKIAYVWPMRYLCRTAPVSAYVTQSALQQHYPPNPKGFTTYYTTLNLKPEAITQRPKIFAQKQKEFTLINVGMMQRLIKGQDILINAVKTLREEGYNLNLILVGDGAQKPLIQNLVQEAGLAEHVTFTGLLPSGDAVNQVLDTADIFVMPSRQEGLPRAMLEAMARGLPCIGSDVGGIPELLPEDAIFPSNNERALTDLLRTVITHTDHLNHLAQKNHTKAQDYLYDKISARRQECYQTLKNLMRT